MADKSLVMSFLTSQGKKTSLKLDNVKDGISDGEVVTLMDTIIAKNIFLTENGYLVQKDGAQLIEKNVSKLRIR